MKITKKYPLIGDSKRFGPNSIPYILIVLYIVSGQFSNVAKANNVIIAFGKLSKL